VVLSVAGVKLTSADPQPGKCVAVYGIEADYGWSNAKGARACTGGSSPFFFTCEAEVNSLASLTARIGHTWGRAG
jgi:hypothetical protein